MTTIYRRCWTHAAVAALLLLLLASTVIVSAFSFGIAPSPAFRRNFHASSRSSIGPADRPRCSPKASPLAMGYLDSLSSFFSSPSPSPGPEPSPSPAPSTQPSPQPTDATLEYVSAALDFLSSDADDAPAQQESRRVPHPPTPQENILDEFGIYPLLAEVVDELAHEEEDDDDAGSDSATAMATGSATGTTTIPPPTKSASITFLPDDIRYDAPDYLPENHSPVDQAHFHENREHPPANCADDSKFDKIWYYSQRHPDEGNRYN